MLYRLHSTGKGLVHYRILPVCSGDEFYSRDRRYGLNKFDVTIATRIEGYEVKDADQVMLRDGILVVVKGNKTLYFNWDRIEYYSVEEQEVSE